MPTKPSIVVALLVGMLVVVYAQQPSAPKNGSPSEVGRFVLFSGPGTNEDQSSTHLYRLDTVTGKTWTFIETTSRATGKPTGALGWGLISEFTPGMEK